MTDTDITALVKRLRGWANGNWQAKVAKDVLEAADALEALQERVDSNDFLRPWQEHWKNRAEKAEAALKAFNAHSGFS